MLPLLSGDRRSGLCAGQGWGSQGRTGTGESSRVPGFCELSEAVEGSGRRAAKAYL